MQLSLHVGKLECTVQTKALRPSSDSVHVVHACCCFERSCTTQTLGVLKQTVTAFVERVQMGREASSELEWAVKSSHGEACAHRWHGLRRQASSMARALARMHGSECQTLVDEEGHIGQCNFLQWPEKALVAKMCIQRQLEHYSPRGSYRTSCPSLKPLLSCVLTVPLTMR